jgi:predicted RNA-binding Zn ribbon-like protein
MDERDKRRVGEQIEPGGRPKAPGRLELLQRFVNTWNHDFPVEWDRIGTPATARAWLRETRLIDAADQPSSRDVLRLRTLREAIRSLAIANHAGGRLSVDALATLRAEGERARIGFGFGSDGSASLEVDARSGVDGAVAMVLAILYEAQLVGTWDRMKACRQCEYFFYDRSKNRSATWCAMAICGNRTKNRTYRRRLATGPVG